MALVTPSSGLTSTLPALALRHYLADGTCRCGIIVA